METTENISKKGSIVKNILLAVFGAALLSSGYFILDQVMENRQLQDQLKQQKSYAKNNERAFSAIESNLGEVASRAGLVFDIPGEGISPGTESNIVKEIVFIGKLMDRNREMIKDLTATLGAKDQRLMKFKRSMAGLEKRMKEYETKGIVMVAELQSFKMDIVEANEEGAELKKVVAELQQGVEERDEEILVKSQMIGWQSDVLSKKEIKIRTAYYVIGTYKDLSTSNVLEKTGGLIGIGSTKILKTDFDRNAFRQIDIYSYTSIPVFSTQANVLTNHSTDSYEMIRDTEGNVQWIRITDPEKFWENSKYLVVETKEPVHAGIIEPPGPEEEY